MARGRGRPRDAGAPGEGARPASASGVSNGTEGPGENLSDLQLVIAGQKGWLYNDILAEIKRLGLAGRVKLTGYVPEADLAPLLSGALAFVYPSLYEGFGLPVLESMACGTPVV